MNSCATWRLNAALWERCLVMAFILRKPSTDGQSQSFIMSTPRGALQSRVSFGCRLTAIDPIRQNDHVRRLRRSACSARPLGDANVSRGRCGGVIDPVANHDRGMQLL